MKLVKIFEIVNQLEKNSFLKILDSIISESKKLDKDVQIILNENDGQIKNADNINIANVFYLTQKTFQEKLADELLMRIHLSLAIDILIRDGNCIMSREWFNLLLKKEVKNLKDRIKKFNDENFEESKFLEEDRSRDYMIFKKCVHTAYFNDTWNNREPTITNDELTILNTLAECLELSKDEYRTIFYAVNPLKEIDIDSLIKELRDLGILFYSKKNYTLYIPDEMVSVLREIRGFSIANKHYRRILKTLKDSQLNQICKRHSIDRKNERSEKISEIISQGIPIQSVLAKDIYKEGTTKTEIKKYISELIEKGLGIELKTLGSTAEDRIGLLIDHFHEIDKDEKLSISQDGYSDLLKDMDRVFPKFNTRIKKEFELQPENVMDRELMIDYNLKPRDLLDLLEREEALKFCEVLEIKSRGNLVENILEAYRDNDDILLENYVAISNRDLNALKENGIRIKESEIGVKFEDLTKKILQNLGFNVDENLRNQLNTAKNKIDLIINLGDNEIIVVECKTTKDPEFKKYATTSRQIKSYYQLAESNGFKVQKTLLVSHDFTDEFIKGCELDFEINLSLLKSASLISILEGFKESKLAKFPYKLLFRDVVLDEKRIVRSLKK